MNLFLSLLICLLMLNACTLLGDRSPRLTPAVPNLASDITQVVLLGTGTPNADPERSGSAVAIVVNGTAYLVDCGPGMVRRAAAAYAGGVEALAMEKLSRVFFTHLHSDHTLGYPDLIFTPWVLDRLAPLEAYGPPGLTAMTDHLMKAYDRDIQVRIHGLEHANPTGCQVKVWEIEAGPIYTDDNVRVIAFPVKHGDWEHAFGFRFETPDRVIVISGDCKPCPSLVAHAKDCDILIHEVYCKKTFDTRPAKWQRYHKASHTSSEELAAIAIQIQPRLLILYHQLFWGDSEDQLLREIRRTYGGEVRSGKDLELY